jgi:hypothetical protein
MTGERTEKGASQSAKPVMAKKAVRKQGEAEGSKEKRLKELAQGIREAHDRCEEAANSMLQYAIQAGELLLEVKETAGHGNWLHWVKKNCRFEERTAQRYMKLARNREILEANPPCMTDLSLNAAEEWLKKQGVTEHPAEHASTAPNSADVDATEVGAVGNEEVDAAYPEADEDIDSAGEVEEEEVEQEVEEEDDEPQMDVRDEGDDELDSATLQALDQVKSVQFGKLVEILREEIALLPLGLPEHCPAEYAPFAGVDQEDLCAHLIFSATRDFTDFQAVRAFVTKVWAENSTDAAA